MTHSSLSVAHSPLPMARSPLPRPGPLPGALPGPLPGARCAVAVRAAVAGDVPFIDRLQKMHSHMVGWFPLKQIEKNIEDGNVLIAEETGVKGSRGQGIEGQPHLMPGSLDASMPSPLGYIIYKDCYMKREDVGIVYQLNVLPLKQRHLVGATLVKSAFERSAYGVRLFCCWCAQDIQANYFWESIGFVPLAFRTGSRAKQRIHIFWQKRVREGDEATPYWFPSQTQNGAVSEDRLVIPIPPGTHWRDAKPVLLPDQGSESGDQKSELPRQLPGGALVKPRGGEAGDAERVEKRPTKAHVAAMARSQSKHLQGVPVGKAAVITRGGVKYIDRADAPAEEEVVVEKKKPRKPRTPRRKHDPKLVKAARELRDKFLEQVNSGMLLPPAAAKYDVCRQLDAARGCEAQMQEKSPRLLDAA